jgi:hypothetical protein
MGGHASFKFFRDKDFAYAANLIETVTWLAGKPDYLDDLREEIDALDLFGRSPGRARSARLFEWLAATMSFQGISDQVAQSYLADHGRPRWAGIGKGIKAATCPLLESYWHFHGCHYRKSSHTCAQPALIGSCPLPAHHFRNGNLNQLAYSLFLFIRDVAGGDLIGWIDSRLAEADYGPDQSAKWLRRLPVTACATCARSSTPTICTAIQRSLMLRSLSSKREQKLPTKLPTALGCSSA